MAAGAACGTVCCIAPCVTEASPAGVRRRRLLSWMCSPLGAREAESELVASAGFLEPNQPRWFAAGRELLDLAAWSHA